MTTYINGRDERVLAVEKLAEKTETAQKQARKQWIITLGVSVATLFAAIAAAVFSILP